MAEPYVAVTTIGEDGSSLLSLLSSRTGELTAMRSSRGRFGPPTFFGNVLLVTLEDNVLAIDPTGGREVARLALPADANGVDQIVVQHPAVVAIGHDRWISITGRQRPTRTLALDPPPFESDGYLDMGLDDGERLRWWVEFPSTGASPREAIMLARRAVLHLRLGADGRPRTSHWAYVGPDQREFVAMHVGRAEVTLVLEDGGLLVLSREDGHEIDRVSGGTEARGALFLDFDRDQHELVRPDRPSAAERARMLAEVVDEQDPRVGPARRLAARLLRLNEEQQ